MESEENNTLVPQPIDSAELDANAEYKGTKEDEEDILLTAQRYLNIYHQIHIFKEFRQKQFRQQLLEIPPEVRRVIALLPGGRVLLEHIAEIMQEEGQSDPTLDALLLTLKQNDHFSDNKISAIKPNAPALSAPVSVPVTPQITGASIELGSNFTNALTESFQTYSQNLKDLSENIQKMILNNSQSNAQASEQGDINNKYAEALTTSFQTYSNDLKELTSSIRQMVQNQQNNTYTPTAFELGGEVAKNLTSSFDTYARNLQDLTESVKQIASNQQQPAAIAAPTSVELGGDFSKALTASFEAYAHNLEDLTASIKQIAANNTGQISASASSQENILPNFTDSISMVLKENAQQQMDVLKSFGEMLSKTIADSQKELVSSIKKSNQNSVIMGKFMQVPVEELADNTPDSSLFTQQAPEHRHQDKPAEPIPVNLLEAADFEPANLAPAETTNISPEIVLKEPVVVSHKKVKENNHSAAPVETRTAEGQKHSPKANQSSNNTDLPQAKSVETPKNKQDIKNKDKNEAKSKKDEELIDLTKSFNDSSALPIMAEEPDEVDIEDVFAQVASSLHTDDVPNAHIQTYPDEDLADAFSETPNSLSQIDTLTQAFSADSLDSHTAEFKAPKQEEKAPKAQSQSAKKADPMAQIRDALNFDGQVSLNDFDDTPISLSPKDTLLDAFTETQPSSQQDNRNFPDTASSAETPDTDWEHVDKNDNSAGSSDAEDWEYEYVDEDGNPVKPSDDAEYEYVDEDGNPVKPSDDAEYEYVDEDGNPVESSDDAEYEYVDEDGNPVEPSDDAEYEYVDEDGNPVEPSDDTEYEYVDEDGNPIEPSDDTEYEYVDENGNPIKG